MRLHVSAERHCYCTFARSPGSTTGYQNVRNYRKGKTPFRAIERVGSREMTIGYYATALEAAVAYARHFETVKQRTPPAAAKVSLALRVNASGAVSAALSVVSTKDAPKRRMPVDPAASKARRLETAALRKRIFDASVFEDSADSPRRPARATAGLRPTRLGQDDSWGEQAADSSWSSVQVAEDPDSSEDSRGADSGPEENGAEDSRSEDTGSEMDGQHLESERGGSKQSFGSGEESADEEAMLLQQQQEEEEADNDDNEQFEENSEQEHEGRYHPRTAIIFKRRRGRPPKNKRWCYQTGVWVPDDRPPMVCASTSSREYLEEDDGRGEAQSAAVQFTGLSAGDRIEV